MPLPTATKIITLKAVLLTHFILNTVLLQTVETWKEESGEGDYSGEAELPHTRITSVFLWLTSFAENHSRSLSVFLHSVAAVLLMN